MNHTVGRSSDTPLELENSRNLDDQGLVARQALEEAAIARSVNLVRGRTVQVVVKGRIICKDCGDPISERRLKALPNATRCRDCQEAVEDPTRGF